MRYYTTSSGGLTSLITGGDPLQGAVQGLVVYFANHLSHKGPNEDNFVYNDEGYLVGFQATDAPFDNFYRLDPNSGTATLSLSVLRNNNTGFSRLTPQDKTMTAFKMSRITRLPAGHPNEETQTGVKVKANNNLLRQYGINKLTISNSNTYINLTESAITVNYNGGRYTGNFIDVFPSAKGYPILINTAMPNNPIPVNTPSNNFPLINNLNATLLTPP